MRGEKTVGIRRSIVGLALAVVVLAGAAPALTSSNGVVISEFRFRGPAGASDEYVELMNTGSGPVDISAWALQGCVAATGVASARTTVPAGVTLQAGEHYLFFNNTATGGYSGSVPGDRGYATGITDGAGARIVDSGGAFVDGVAGTAPATSDCREGNGISGMPTTNGDQSYERKNGGAQDTNDNASDFTGPKVGNPQNHAGADAAPSVTSRSPGVDAADVATAANVSVTFSEPVNVTGSWYSISCATSGTHTAAASGGPTTFTLDPDSDFAAGEGCTVTLVAAQISDQDTNDPPDHPAADIVWSFTTAAPSTPTPIHDIQGLAHISPKNGQLVSSVTGVVIAKTSNGFWMQDPNPDADSATSEGIFVFTSSAPTANVGDAVSVNARVQEFRPGGVSTGNLTTTELASPSVSVLSTGNPLPAPTVIGTGGRIPPNTIIDNDSTGSAETSGIFDPDQDGLDFYESLEAMRVQLNNAVAVGPTDTGFGETPVIGDNGDNASVRTYRGGLLLRESDGNPERITLDDVLTPLPNVNVGDHYSGPIVGVMDYNFGNPFLNVTSPGLTRVPGSITRETTADPAPGELVVATFNFENLAFTNAQSKFDSLASLIVNNLRSPDVLAGEEVQDNNGATDNGVVDASQTLQRLVDAIVAAGGPSYAWREIDPVNDQDGGEPGGNIRQVILFRADRGISFVDRPGGGSTTPNTVTGSGATTQLQFSPGRIAPADSAWNASRKPLAAELTYQGHKLFVIVNHFNSKGGDDPLRGRFQPPVQSSATQRHQQATLVANFVSQIGSADPSANVIVLGDLNDFEFSETVQILRGAGLHDLMDTLPLNQRYSYEFEGNAQVLDHIMVSGALSSMPSLVFDPVHVNAEFFDQVSDHDPSVMRVKFNQAPTVSAGGPYTVGEGSSINLTATGNDPEGGALTYAWDLDNNGSFETPGQTVSFSAGDGPSSPVVRVQVTDNGGETATDQTTVTVQNVPPTATFSAPASSFAGYPFTLSLTSPHDPSAADTAAGFQYAFDCGSGYGAFGSSSSASCPTDDTGTRTVHGKIRDKDGGETEYTATVQITVTFQSLCNLTRLYSTKVALATRLCGLLASAEADANSGTPPPKPKNPPRKPANKYLNRYVDQVNSSTPTAFTPAQAATLTRLAQRLDDQYFAPSHPGSARTVERSLRLTSRTR
jgi:predicted extracellular nuclease